MEMSTKKIFLLAIITLIILLAIVGVVLKFFVFNDKNENKEEVKDKYKYEVDEILCNLKNTNSITRLKIIVETTDEKLIKEFEEKSYLIKNKVNEIVRNKTHEDLEGSEGQLSLQRELITELNDVFSTNEIVNIYFDEFIIQ